MAAILQIRRGTNASTSSITFSESELFYNQSKETLQIANGSNSLVTLARLDRINTGSLYLTGDFTASNALFTGDITFGGSLITLGDANTDNIVIGGELSSSIIPNNDNAFDLGSETRRYKSIFSVSGSISNINGIDFSNFVSSTNTFTSSINTTIKSKMDADGVISGSSQVSYLGLSNIPAGIVSGSSQVTQSLDTRYLEINGDSVVSGSSQLTASLDTRYLEINGDSVVSGSTQVKNLLPAGTVSGSSQVTSSLDGRYELQGRGVASGSSQFTASYDTRYELQGRGIVSGSSQLTSSLDARYANSASINSDLSNLHSYTASVNADLSTLHSYTASIDSKFSTLSTYTASIDSKFVAVGISTASLNAYTASQDTKNSALATYTASVNADLTNLHSYTASVNADLTNLHSYTSSLRTAIDVTGQNLTVYGDLTVQGNTTTLNTTELVVEDKLLSLASGSTTSAQADGAGLHISGANVLITWNDANSLVNVNQKVSSSVGFKGNGSELTGVVAAAVDYTNITNKPTLVSGSSQVTSSLDFRYLTIDGDSVVSGSSQIDLTGTTNYISGIKSRLNAEGVISGSTQITNGSGLLSSSYINFANYTASVTNDLNALHGFTSSQEAKNTTLGTYTSSIDSKFTTLGTYTSSIDSKFNTLATYTASVNADLSNLHSYTASNDTNITNLFNTASQYQAFSSSINTTIKTKLNTEGVVSGSTDSSTIDFTITNGVITGNVIGGIVSGSSQVTQSLDGRYEVSGSVAQLVGIRAVSGSLGSAAWYNVTSSGDIALVSGSITYNNNHLLTAGAIKKYVDWRTEELVLAIGAADITSVTSGNDGITGGATFGAVTLSLDTNSTTFTTGVKNKLNADGVISGSSQVSYVGLSNIPTGIVSGSSQLTSSFDTRYLNTNGDGVISGSSQVSYLGLSNIPVGILSSSAQIDSLFNLDGIVSSSTQITPLLPNGTVSGSSQVVGILSSLNSFTQSYFSSDSASFDSRLDSLEAYSSSLLVPTSSLSLRTLQTDTYVKNTTGAQINKGTVVRIIGNTGDNALIATASYDSEGASANTLGITTQDIPNDSWGFVITEGVLVDVNTSGMNSGDLLYLGANGSFTTTTPIAPLHSVRLGQVLRPQSNNGSIQVRIDNGAELGELHNVIDNSTISSYGDILMRSGSVWVNDSTFSASVDSRLDAVQLFTSSQETKNTTLASYTSSIDAKFTTLSSYTASVNSSLSQLNAVSHSHANKTNLDTINQNLATTSDVNFGSLHTTGTGSIGTNLTVYGNLTVFGTQSIINSTNLEVADNIIYLAPTASGDWDLGIVGHYNDGVYKHAGIFSDASDGHAWKVFKDLTSETTGSVDTSAPTFTLADFKAANFTGTSFNGTINATNGVISGSSQLTASFDTRYLNTDGDGVISGSSQVSYLGLSNIPAGIVSGSSQVSYVGLSNIPAGIVSGSSQITKTLQNVTTAGATTSDAITITNSTASTTSTTGALIVTGGVGIGGSVNVAGDVVAYSSSDRRLKNEITPIENPLQKINAIGGYSFVWNEDAQNTYKGKDYGVIAQEIEEILPELVDNRENGYKAVKYDRLVSLLIEGIKDLSNQVEELKQQINKG